MKQVILLLACLLLSVQITKACRCALPLPDFWITSKQAPVIALVKVTSYAEYSENKIPVAISAKVIYTHKGNISSSYVMIYGGNGRGGCTQFVPQSLSFFNKYLLVAIYKRDRDYAFGGCGSYYFNMTYWIYGVLLLLISLAGYGFFRKRKKASHNPADHQH